MGFSCVLENFTPCIIYDDFVSIFPNKFKITKTRPIILCSAKTQSNSPFSIRFTPPLNIKMIP